MCRGGAAGVVWWSVTMAAPSRPSERELLEDFLDRPGNDTYSALFRVVAPQVMSYLRLRGCPPPAAEDLTQDVMLIMYREANRLRDRSLFRPWLFKIARNALVQYRRKQEREHPVEFDELPAPAGDPLAAADFSQWMKALEPKERETMMLRYVEGLEYHEIAALQEIPIGTVQWRIFQTKKKLAARFGKGVPR
jgi:RNA polymerase sigma factor (sigma-70 family)